MIKFKFLILLLVISLPATAKAAEVSRVQSENNFSAWMIEEHSLPVVSVRLAFDKSGYAYDRDGKEGLAHMVSKLLLEGAGNLDGNALKERLEELAIRIRISQDKDYFYVSMKTLSENLDEAFKLLGIILSAPHFTAEATEIIREQILTGIAKDNEDVHYVAAEEWRKTILHNHPYAKPAKGTHTSVNSITEKDLHNFVKNKLSQSSMIIGVVGDISERKLKLLLDKNFAALPEKPMHYVDIAEKNIFPDKSIKYIEKEVPQSVAFFGQEGIKYSHPDFYAAYILNYIFGGGGFESRLVNEIREKRGLAYSVSTHMEFYSHAAIMKGVLSTRNEQIEESLDVLQKEIKKLHEHGVTNEEVKLAKQYLTGSFATNLDTSEKLANYLVFMQAQNLEMNFLKTRNSMIESVTTEDVNRVAKELINPEKLIIVVVGKKPQAR